MAEWTRDQLIIALEFYYGCAENMHTDAHVMCQEVASLVEHTPGALDRVIRNIKYVDTGGTGLEHASQLIYDVVDRYKGDQTALRTEAARIRAANGWGDLECHD